MGIRLRKLSNARCINDAEMLGYCESLIGSCSLSYISKTNNSVLHQLLVSSGVECTLRPSNNDELSYSTEVKVLEDIGSFTDEGFCNCTGELFGADIVQAYNHYYNLYEANQIGIASGRIV